MNIKNTFIKILFILLYLFSIVAHAVDIQVKVDRTQVELNETFTLIFESTEDPDDDPDFSPLAKDFQILNQSTSSNISIINGEYTRSKKWKVSLIALHDGVITIPPIRFGSDNSQSYQIKITQPQKSTGKAGEAFISELNVDTDTAYTQAQIIITQRLLSSSNINAYEFSPLKFKGVEVVQEKLGEVKQYQTSRGNTPYLVLEQSYALYPQSAGELIIEPSVASARVAIQGSRSNRSAFDPFRSNTKTIRRLSDRKKISVKAISKKFKGHHWLPSKEVQLVEEFPEATSFKAGEPITRTLLLIADGQLSSQLPEFTSSSVKGLKQYPDKPLLKNNISDNGITGVQQIKVALIPSIAGQYTLPAIKVPWWNTKTNKLEVARIKSRTFTVVASGASPTLNAQPPVDKISTQPENSDIPSLQTVESAPQSITRSADNSLPWKLTTFLLAIGLSIALFFLWKKQTVKPETKTVQAQDTVSLKKSLNELKQACDLNNAQNSKTALLHWARALYINEPIHSLGELSDKVDDELAKNINLLNVYLYKNTSDNWQCNTLYSLCVKFTEQFEIQLKSSDKTVGELESLYK
jgi:oxygen tolerance protein BatD